MTERDRIRKRNENIAMLIMAGLVVAGIVYIIKDLDNNGDRQLELENELKFCESNENYERCAEIKRILDNLKNR
jgi:hypothetical protein